MAPPSINALYLGATVINKAYLGSTVVFSAGGSEVTPPTVYAATAYVFNADTDATYYSKTGAAEDMASTSKVATVSIIARDYADLSVTTTVVSGDLVGGSTMNLHADDVVSLHDLLKGALLPSGCDAVMALARKWRNDFGASGGSDPVGDFVDEMNALAATLGLDDTIFGNPHGLSGANTSTAQDLGILFKSVLDNYPVLISIMKFYRMSASITGGRTTTLTFTNTNNYIENGGIGHYAGKTGSGGGGTKESLVVGWIAPNGDRIVAAIVASNSDAHRYADMDALLGQLVIDFPALTTFTWTPASLSHLVNWLDPSDMSTMYQTTDTSTPVTAAGQSVGRIEDKSGNSTHATQSTSGSRPTLRNPSGDLWYLDFDGGDWLTYGAQVLGGTHLFAESSDTFVVLVAGQYDGDAGTMIAKASATAGNRTFQMFAQISTSAEPGCHLRGTGIKVDQNVVTNETLCVMGAMWDGVDAALNVGSLIGWRAGDSVGTHAEESQDIIIGARTGGSGARLTGKIYGIIVCDAFDEVEWVQAMRYLNLRLS